MVYDFVYGILVFTRFVPYFDNGIPLGYDPGIYKASFESYRDNMPERYDDGSWLNMMIPPGVPMITNVFYLLGFDTNFILIYGLIFFDLLNLLMVYLVSREFFGRDVAVLNSFIFSISTVQLLAFWFGYYKNIVGIFLILLTIYLIQKKMWGLAVFSGGFLGGVHRPTFLVYGVSHLVNWFRRFGFGLFFSGLGILGLTIGFYLKDIYSYIFNFLFRIVGDVVGIVSDGGGTFLTIEMFEFAVLAYLLFGIVGILNYRKFDFLSVSFWFLFVMVYFELFFFKRFIIHLNLFLILFSGYGLYLVLANLSKFKRSVLLGLLVLSSVFFSYSYSQSLEPLITEDELSAIEWMSIQDGEYAMSLDKYYSPWVLGWSSKKTIAPGLFDENKWNEEEWRVFWNGNSSLKHEMIVFDYGNDVMIFQGKYKVNDDDFQDEEYFEKVYNISDLSIYIVK